MNETKIGGAALPFSRSKPGPASALRSEASRTNAQYDRDLVRRFHTGDESAFAEIMTRHHKGIFAIAFRLLKNSFDAEEIAQDTFIRAHRGLAAFRGESSLATWLHHIALNLARNRYWYFFRRRRHATLSLDCPFSPENQATISDQLASADACPAREAVTQEFAALVAECMERLGPVPREILTLRNSSNRSYAEIAQELGLSIGTVKSRIARARDHLRVLLSEACPEFGPEAEPEAWFEIDRPKPQFVARFA